MKKQTETLLKEWYLSDYNSFLLDLYDEYEMFIIPGMYDIFTFEILHNLYLGMSKLIKKSLYNYVCSSRSVVMTLSNGKKRIIGSLKNQILKACLLYTSPSPRDA